MFRCEMLSAYHTFLSILIIVGNSIFLDVSVHSVLTVLSIPLVILVCIVSLVGLGTALPVLVRILLDETSQISRNVEMAESNSLGQRSLVPSVDIGKETSNYWFRCNINFSAYSKTLPDSQLFEFKTSTGFPRYSRGYVPNESQTVNTETTVLGLRPI